jgi:hypothetical protein
MALEQTSGPPLSRTLVFTNKPQSYLGMALARLRRDPLTLAALPRWGLTPTRPTQPIIFSSPI